jgi:hypothetical protein
MTPLLLGPILGFESGTDGAFYTCLVVISGEAPVWLVDGIRVPFAKLADAAIEGAIWRAEWPMPANRAASRQVNYTIEAGGQPAVSSRNENRWKFYLPAVTESIRFVYGSCNGFSALKLMASTAEPHKMWERMMADHADRPLSLIVLGGDQVYADAVWEQDWMRGFAEMTEAQMAVAPVTSEMEANMDSFYEKLYLRQWNAPPVAAMLASVPSIMMWDDHDIFDGWGSHPDAVQHCAVYARIYQSAHRAFQQFQLRGNLTRGFLEPGVKHHAYATVLNGETFLMLDHRTERTPTVVMAENQWIAVKAWLAKFEGKRLFIQSAVPVIYRTFGLIERALATTNNREELEDDLNDHWSAREHQKERLRLIYTLIGQQQELKKTNAQFDPHWLFLSGDVHVGCMGSVWEKDLNLGVYQVVSSGLVHPPPTMLQWLGICAVSGDGNDRLGNGELVTEIHPIAGAASRFLRTRNYARLELEPEKVWINWRCENGDETVFRIS